MTAEPVVPLDPAPPPPPSADPPPRDRHRRALTAIACVLAVAATGLGIFRLAQQWGYFLPTREVGGLPLVEVPAPADSAGDLMVVLLSADGGWARLDQELSARLANAGYPVVGWNSPRYFSTERTPASAADDLSAVMRAYQRKWGRRSVLLVGYSFGADVLPFMIARLPAGDRANVAGVVLLALWADAEFQFRPAQWLGKHDPLKEYATLPAVRRLTDLPVLCIAGDGDRHQVCPQIGTPNARSVLVRSGHSLGAHANQVFDLMMPMIRRIDR